MDYRTNSNGAVPPVNGQGFSGEQYSDFDTAYGQNNQQNPYNQQSNQYSQQNNQQYSQPFNTSTVQTNNQNGAYPEVGWNWGAFMYSWVFGLANGSYLGLLVFIPIPLVHLIWGIIFGFNGAKWCYNSGKYNNVGEFNAVMRSWDSAGKYTLVLILIMVVLLVLVGILIASLSASVFMSIASAMS